MTRTLLTAAAAALAVATAAGQAQARTTKTSGAVRGHVQEPEGEPGEGDLPKLLDGQQR